MILPMTEFGAAFKAALTVPVVDLLNSNMLAIGRSSAMNDYAFDLSCHAAMMAEDKKGNKEEAGPPVGFGRRKLTG